MNQLYWSSYLIVGRPGTNQEVHDNLNTELLSGTNETFGSTDVYCCKIIAHDNVYSGFTEAASYLRGPVEIITQ